MIRKIKIILLILIPFVLVISYFFYIFLFLSSNNSKNNPEKFTWDINSNNKKNNNLIQVSNDWNNETANNQNDLNQNNDKENLEQQDTTQNNLQTDESLTWFVNLNIYMPYFFINNWFKDICKKLLKQQIKCNFINTKIYSLYDKTLLDKLDKWLSWGIDIFMIKTDNIKSYEKYWIKLEFKNSISSMMNYIFYELIENKDYTFIPYSIDPLVTFVSENFSKTFNWNLEFNDLKEYILLNTDKTKIKDLRLLFWIWENDIKKLKNYDEVYNDYFFILYNIIYQSYLVQNKDYLKFFLDISKQWNSSNARDSNKFERLNNSLTKWNNYCKFFWNICLFMNWYWDVLFWTLSNLDIIDNNFFSTKIKKNNIQINNFILNSNNYPVRWRWFIINTNSKNMKESVIFINEYITQWSNWNIYLWNNSLSAFNNVLQKQKMNDKLSKIFDYETKFYLIEWDIDLMKNFINNTNILKVLSFEYSIEAFLDNLNRWF